MKETYYFPHDYNATQDPKIMTLLIECGLSGIGLYWIIIEILHQQPAGRITEDEFKRYLQFYARSENEQVLNKIEQVLNATNLLLKKDGFIYSERVIKNKKYREDITLKRSLAGKKSAEIRQKATSVEQVLNKCGTKGQQGKERKGKEMKGNKKNKDIRKTYIPDNFSISDNVRNWAGIKGIYNLEEHLDNFTLQCKAKGYEYKDWDSAFKNAIKSNWAKITNTPKPIDDDPRLTHKKVVI